MLSTKKSKILREKVRKQAFDQEEKEDSRDKEKNHAFNQK